MKNLCRSENYLHQKFVRKSCAEVRIICRVEEEDCVQPWRCSLIFFAFFFVEDAIFIKSLRKSENYLQAGGGLCPAVALLTCFFVLFCFLFVCLFVKVAISIKSLCENFVEK